MIQSVSEVAFWVEDVEQAADFYVTKLGFRLEDHEPGKHAFLRSGDFLLVLFNPADPGTKLATEYLARAGAPKGGLYHIAFRVSPPEIDGIAAGLRECGVETKGPVDFEGGRRSYFFEDPDEHYIELTDR